jgi:hypothetical protein
MESRSEQLRRRHRRIFGWSLAVAAMAHLGVFALFPAFSRAAAEFDPSEAETPAVGAPGSTRINVIFGPPEIRLDGGAVRVEPPDRVLEARSVDITGAWLGRECRWVGREGLGVAEGAVRLDVQSSGRVARAEVVESSGDLCRDRVLVTVAGSLWYRWLPDAETPAPVDLVQPMRAESVLH